MLLGSLVRFKREQLGWSTTDLATKSNTTSVLVERLEVSGVLPSRVNDVQSILTALEITPSTLWRDLMAETTASRPYFALGGEPQFVNITVADGPIKDFYALDEMVFPVVEAERIPALFVIRDTQWHADGEQKALDIAAELRDFYGPSYQVRTGPHLSLVWDPSVITLTRWQSSPVQARVRTVARAELTLTSDPGYTPPQEDEGLIVVPTTAGMPPNTARVRAIGEQAWVCPELHDSIIPGTHHTHPRYTHASFLLPWFRSSTFLWNNINSCS